MATIFELQQKKKSIKWKEIKISKFNIYKEILKKIQDYNGCRWIQAKQDKKPTNNKPPNVSVLFLVRRNNNNNNNNRFLDLIYSLTMHKTTRMEQVIWTQRLVTVTKILRNNYISKTKIWCNHEIPLKMQKAWWKKYPGQNRWHSLNPQSPLVQKDG